MFHALLLTLTLTEGADCALSHEGLRRQGVYETVLTQNQYVNDGVMLGRAGAEWFALTRLRRSHPKLAWAVAGGLLAVNGYVIASNVRVIQTHPYYRLK